MSSEDQPIETRPQAQPDEQKSAWHVIQQGAQAFGEIGGGLGGIAGALHVGRTMLGGSNQSEPNTEPQQQVTQPPEE
jgi:hypothetical protein